MGISTLNLCPVEVPSQFAPCCSLLCWEWSPAGLHTMNAFHTSWNKNWLFVLLLFLSAPQKMTESNYVIRCVRVSQVKQLIMFMLSIQTKTHFSNTFISLDSGHVLCNLSGDLEALANKGNYSTIKTETRTKTFLNRYF